jgi:copper chaperone CopZ
MSSATLNIEQAADFWRVARRLHSIYAELDATYELGMPPCSELQDSADRQEPETMERVRQWFDQMDSRIQVWQLRQLLQSTALQNEENLRYLIVRHLERAQKTEADKEKLDFLLVQYFAHCAPHGMAEQQLTLDEVAGVLEPVLGPAPDSYPDWAPGLDDKLELLNDCNSLEDLQNSGALLEVRELKLAVGDQYFEPGLLVAFTRFNFRARRAFFKAMHLDLHAIREAVNELEQRGYTSIDCREAGLTENESLAQVRHVVHQWKTPFRAPYSGGSSFLQLILLRHILQATLNHARSASSAQVGSVTDSGSSREVDAAPAFESTEQPTPPEVQVSPAQEPVPEAFSHAEQISTTQVSRSGNKSADPLLMQIGEAPVPDRSEPETSPTVPFVEEDDYLSRCVADITEQLSAVPPKNSPSVSAITLAGCKLLIATWEAQAFIQGDSEMARSLQRTVAARTILHVCMERHRKGEATDVTVALELARQQVKEMEVQVSLAKEASNIDAAVNLAATTKRLLSLIEEAGKLSG